MASISLSKFQLVLQKAITLNASDIHLGANNFVYLRRKNELKIDKTYFFSNSDIINVLGQILSECQRDLLKRQKALDCAYAYADRRFRLNVDFNLRSNRHRQEHNACFHAGIYKPFRHEAYYHAGRPD